MVRAILTRSPEHRVTLGAARLFPAFGLGLTSIDRGREIRHHDNPPWVPCVIAQSCWEKNTGVAGKSPPVRTSPGEIQRGPVWAETHSLWHSGFKLWRNCDMRLLRRCDQAVAERMKDAGV